MADNYDIDKEAQKSEGKGEEDKNACIPTARKRANDGSSYWKENWELAEDDLKFLGGEQWPPAVKTERENEGRPCLTNNVLPTFVDQAIGDQLQNKPAIKVNAVDVPSIIGEDGKPQELKIKNQAGNKDYTLSEALTGIVKGIEYSCEAESEYDIAYQAAVESGMGYLRVRTEWVGEKMQQEILIESIENQFSVTLDPSAKKRDYRDMNWALLDENMEKAAFELEYPDATPEPIDGDSVDDGGSWFSENTVRVSEYFVREPIVKELVLLSDGRTEYMDKLKLVLDELAEKGITVKRTRKVKTFKVIWRKITGNEVLEGPTELDFTSIPIVPVWGKCSVVKKKKIFRSLIRYGKDAQRMSNYWDSAATEAVALAPKAPFIGTPEQIEGFPEWDTANTVNHSMLRYNKQDPNDPGPRREQPAAIPAAELTLGQTSVDKIKSTIGMFDASRGASSQEKSGRAIIALQRQGDRGSFAFIDNLSKAITRVGRLVVEVIPKVMDTEQLARMKLSDDSEDFIMINEQIFDDESGEWVTIHDLGVAKYDVVVTTGPAFATQRMEAAESMIQFAQAVPQAAAVMADLIAQNSDWPGADVIAERLKKIMPPNVLTAEEREKLQEDMPEQQEPTPEQQIQMAEIELKQAEIEAGNAKTEADVLQAQADMKKAEADIAQAEADMLEAQLDTDDARAKLKVIEDGANGGDIAFQQVREMVAEAIAELASPQEAI